MRKIIFVFFSLFSLFAGNAIASCGVNSNTAKMLGLKQSDIDKNSSDFNCVEIAFLKKANIAGISKSDYLKKFKIGIDKAKELVKNGITPDKVFFTKLKNFNIQETIEELKDLVLSNYSVVFDKTKGTFVKNGKKCSVQSLGDFSDLNEVNKPAYFSGNIIFNLLRTKMGTIKANQDGTATLTIGNITKKIKWDEDCYSQNTLTQFSNILTSCWLCPMYDLLFKAMSEVSYKVWHKLRKPMLKLLAMIFLIWFAIKMIKMFWGIEEFKINFFKTDLLKKLGALAIAGFVLGAPETGYDIVKDFMSLVLIPLSEVSVYVSDLFLEGAQCNYDPMAISTHESMFDPEIKNNIVCLLEKLLDFFVDYIIIGFIILLKSLGILVEVLLWGLASIPIISNVVGIFIEETPEVEFLNSLFSFIFTFLLAIGLIVSLLGQMFKTLFYLVDPILKLGIMFFWLPFTFINWVVDLGIKKSKFTEHFRTMIEGIVVLVFTALIVSLCGSILLSLMSGLDEYELFKQAIKTKSFMDMWDAIQINDTTIIRLIMGIIIVHVLMKNIEKYTTLFTGFTPDDEIGKKAKDEVNKQFLEKKEQYKKMNNKLNFIKRMRR